MRRITREEQDERTSVHITVCNFRCTPRHKELIVTVNLVYLFTRRAIKHQTAQLQFTISVCRITIHVIFFSGASKVKHYSAIGF